MIRVRRVILGALVTFGVTSRLPVMRALNAAMNREDDPIIREAINGALTMLIMADSGPTRSARL